MIALIIWGTKGVTSTVGQGQFFCPRCQTYTPFSHQKVQRYFTLYFIPLFPVRTLGEFVLCHACGGQYNTQVLQSPQQMQGGWGPPR